MTELRLVLVLVPLFLTAGLAAPAHARGTTATASTGCVVEPILGDLNADCIVNTADLLIALMAPPAADLDGNGAVDADDYAILSARFGTTCGTRLLGDLDGNGIVQTADLLLLTGGGTTALEGDLNRDGSVDGTDQAMLKANFGATMGARTIGDVNGDDVVDNSDVLAVLTVMYTSAPSPCEINGDGIVDDVDLGIVQARLGMLSGVELMGDLDGDDVVDSRDVDLADAAQGTTLERADLNNDGIVSEPDALTVGVGFDTIAGNWLSGDIDGNWVVDAVDLALLTATFSGAWRQADLTGDGIVNTSDLLILLGGYGTTHAGLNGDVDGDCWVDGTDLGLVLAALGADWPQADVDGSGGSITVSDLLAMVWGPVPSCPY